VLRGAINIATTVCECQECDDCGHCKDLHQPSHTDPKPLKRCRIQAVKAMKKWMMEAVLKREGLSTLHPELLEAIM